MKIGYIGRLNVFDIFIEKSEINKLDIHYKSIQENLYNLNIEIIKLYKITSLDTVYIDYACIENDQDAIKILKSAMAVRFNVKFNILVSDRKLYNNEFNIINISIGEIEIKKDEEEEKNKEIIKKFLEKDKFKLPKLSFPKKMKLSLPKIQAPKIRMPEIKIPKIEMPEIKIPSIQISKKEIEKKPKAKFNINTIIKQFNKDKEENGEKISDEATEQFVEKRMDIELNKKINIFFSTLELQGTSYVVNSLKNNKTAILDLDLSYIKYTDFMSMEEYLEETYISSNNPKLNELNIYTTENKSIIKIINYLEKHYEYILIDSNNHTEVEKIREIFDSESYAVISGEYKNIKAIEYFDDTKLVVIKNSDEIDIKHIENITRYSKENILKVG